MIDLNNRSGCVSVSRLFAIDYEKNTTRFVNGLTALASMPNKITTFNKKKKQYMGNKIKPYQFSKVKHLPEVY